MINRSHVVNDTRFYMMVSLAMCIGLCEVYTSRKHGKKELQSFFHCGFFDHPDLQSLMTANLFTGRSLHCQVENHVRTKFANPILYAIDNFTNYDIFLHICS